MTRHESPERGMGSSRHMCTLVDMAQTIAQRLARLDTPNVIAEYDRAISTPGRRYAANGRTPLQRRINAIVDELSMRADNNDPVALAWYETED